MLSGCHALSGIMEPATMTSPRLSSRVAPPTGTATAGTTVPYNQGSQAAVLYVPATYRPSTPAPLVLMLHGAGSVATSALNLFQPYADGAGLVLLAVDSYSSTWDIVFGRYGPDVTFIDAALAAVFRDVNVDPTRVTVEGFSDGASYALAVGRTNGDLFSRVISFSAGFMPPNAPHGAPTFFMSHGVNDTLLNVAQTGRLLSQQLVTAGYNVDYVEFDGGHEVPDAIARQAVAWLAR